MVCLIISNCYATPQFAKYQIKNNRVFIPEIKCDIIDVVIIDKKNKNII